MKHVTIIGCGDVGRRVGTRWLAKGWQVYGVARSKDTLAALQSLGITPLQADLDTAQGLQQLPLKDALLYIFSPPPERGDTDPRMGRLLQVMQPGNLPSRVVAISTSGVYGDQAGALIDEETPVHPQTDRGRRRLHGEMQLRAWGRQHQVPVIILRVGGIYGPGRLPLERIQKGIPVLHEALAPRTNRIHVEDLATVCVAAAERGEADRIYNVSDGQGSNMTDYFYTIADAFGLPRPPAVDWEEAERVMSAGMLSYLRESRAMSNQRMLEELQVHLRYPSLREALRELAVKHDT